MQQKTTTVDGVHMRWLEQGEGTSVVPIHGIPNCPKLWRHVVPRPRRVRKLAREITPGAGRVGRRSSVARRHSVVPHPARRVIPEGAKVHDSVRIRMEQRGEVVHLPKQYTIVDQASRPDISAARCGTEPPDAHRGD